MKMDTTERAEMRRILTEWQQQAATADHGGMVLRREQINGLTACFLAMETALTSAEAKIEEMSR
jgi:hypothetical protein